MSPLWSISVFLPQNNPELCAGRQHRNVEIGVERRDARRLERHGFIDRLARALRKIKTLRPSPIALLASSIICLSACRPAERSTRIIG